ncbi:MAG: sugar-binding domain-containing protein, partial [Pyrinomonadaceae bacterium]
MKLRATAILLCLLLFTALAHAQTVKLESGWQFFADKTGAAKIETLPNAQSWRPVRVGLSWNAQFADLRDYMGVAWYRTTFDVPAPAGKARHCLLRFGAVDYYSEVFVNGKRVGEHEGGYTPFEFDVTNDVKAGANELVVRVVDPPMDEKENQARFPEMMYNEIPHGKQNWYVQTGGIWQAVTLEIKPEAYITKIKVITKTDGNVRAVVYANGNLGPPPPAAPPPGRGSFAHARSQSASDLKVNVIDPSGKSYALTLKGGGGNNKNDYAYFEGRIPNPQLWNTEHPNLYTIEARFGEDRYTDRFGFRTFEARDGKLYLNGEPFYMIAALDQDFYPETIYTPPSEEFVRDEMLKGKRLGLNLLRCHIKVPDPVYLKVADEVGMLVWYEIPSWNDFHHFSQKAAERGEKIFAEQVERDWNHPSIVIQSVINEAWGADLKDEAQRKWLRAAFERAKKITAPLGRVITDNSACCDNFHVKSDLDDFHQYNSQPDYRETWDAWVADFASRPKFTYSPHGDAERTGREPLLVSEFGNWGLPKLPKDLPWWFPRDFGGREITRPADVFGRFKEFQFTRLFKDYNDLAINSQWHQFISLKHEIEEMRRYASIQGYVITEFTDLNWEANGLMDMWRNPKVYATELAKIQQPDVILARLTKINYTSGERVEAETLISHYSKRELSGARVRWFTDTGAAGNFVIDRSISPSSVAALQSIAFDAPPVPRPRRERLVIEVR